MKKLIKTISNHKAITTTICGVFALALVGVIGYNQYKINNTYKALEMGADGVITSEELSDLGEIALGETITTADGQQVVVTQDANGNYIVTPQNPTTPGGNTPTPISHTHTWVAQYNTITHPAITHTEKVLISPAGYCCNTCGYIMTTSAEQSQHIHTTGHGGCHTVPAQYDTIVVTDQAAWTEQVLVGYQCSECGAWQ